MKHSALGPIAQWALGIFFTLATLAAGAASFWMNVSFGLQTSVNWAVLFGLSDCLKIALPAVAIVLGWQVRTRILWLIAIGLSLLSAVSYLLETQGNRLLAAQHTNAVIQSAKTDIETARAELSAIDELLDVKTLTDLHKAKMDAAEREGARGSCGPKCEGLIKEADALLARLGKAKRKAELEAQLQAAKTTVVETPEQAIGSVNVLASLTGADKDQIGSVAIIVISVVGLLLLELAATLSDNAMGMLRSAYRAGKKVKVKSASAPDRAHLPTDAKSETLLKLQTRISNAPGDELVESKRALAALYEIPRTTFAEWCAGSVRSLRNPAHHLR